MAYIGIDPGKTGGIAVVNAAGDFIGADRMPATARDLATLMRNWQIPTHVTLEYVSSRPGQGHTGAFTFGRGFGRIEGVLEALEIPYNVVTPQVWQRRMCCLTKGDKNISKARAQRMFGHLEVTHWMADALLLASYGRLVDVTLQHVRKPRQGDRDGKKEGRR
jgi:crossover junction endodeoxyribonuclease RuvC